MSGETRVAQPGTTPAHRAHNRDADGHAVAVAIVRPIHHPLRLRGVNATKVEYESGRFEEDFAAFFTLSNILAWMRHSNFARLLGPQP